MRVWVIKAGEPLPIDADRPRKFRAGWIAHTLAARGHDVTWWTGRYNHSAKRDRDVAGPAPDDFRGPAGGGVAAMAPNYRLHLLPGPPYARNASFARIRNHRHMAKAFAAWAEREPAPDVIHCALPTIRLPWEATRYGRRHGVPVVVDCRDQWPDLFVEPFAPVLRPFARAALWPLKRRGRAALRAATAISGMTDEFMDWGLRRAGRARGAWDRSFPFGYQLEPLTPAEDAAAREFWRGQGVPLDGSEFLVCFLGALGHQFEDGAVEAARLLSQDGGRPVRFVFCGAGDRAEDLRRAAADIPRVHFPGQVGRAALQTLMAASSVGLNTHPSTPNYVINLTNKPIEYLAGGLPVVSSLRGVLERLLAEHGCGVTYPNGDARALAAALADLRDHPDKRARMAANARALYEARFRADRVYGDLADWLEAMARAFAPTTQS